MLNREGYTMGHYPQSFEYSTLGGWVVTRSAGQASTYYGKIEDLVQAVKVATPRGEMRTDNFTHNADGINLLNLFVGSEGTLGVVTQVTVKIHPIPSNHRWLVALFQNFDEGAECMRQIMRQGIRPSVIRLSDNPETALLSMLSHEVPTGKLNSVKKAAQKLYLRLKNYQKPNLLMLRFEEPAHRRDAVESHVKKLIAEHNGMSVSNSIGENWEKSRYHLPYLRDTMLEHRVMIDTMETVVPWSQVGQMHTALNQALRNCPDFFKDKGLALTHISHIYPQGACMYFMLLCPMKKGDELRQWQNIKKMVTDTIIANGGAVSHHHGVGADHQAWYLKKTDPLALSLLRNIKSYLDPKSILNPGRLFQAAPSTRPARLRQASDSRYDVAIIGGGITGAGLFLKCCQKGLKTILVEKNDFASGTSSKSSKLIHGGLRYLEQFQFKLIYEGLNERKFLLKNYPHLVKPQPFLLPVYKSYAERLKMALGLRAYGLLTGKTDLPKHEYMEAEQIAEKFKGIKTEDLKGGYIYYDARTNDARLTIEVIQQAMELGGTALNHLEVLAFNKHKNEVESVACRDRLTGDIHEIEADLFINATGAWTDEVLRRLDAEEEQTYMNPGKGVHLVIKSSKLPTNEHVLLLPTADDDGRFAWVVPWDNGLTIVGTTDTDYDGSADQVRVLPEEVQYLLRAVNGCFPTVQLTEEDVLSVYAGLRPLLEEQGEENEEDDSVNRSREYNIWWSAENLMSLAGGKLTSFLSMAEHCLEEAEEKLPDLFVDKKTVNKQSQSGIKLPDFGELPHLDEKLVIYLKETYGERHQLILGIIAKKPDLAKPLHKHFPYTKAEIVYFIQYQKARTLDDMLTRRSTISYACKTYNAVLVEEVCRIAAPVLQWISDDVAREKENYKKNLTQMSVPKIHIN